MKRIHVQIQVKDLDESRAFYSTLFGTSPSLEKDDYAKWHLDDPAVNFSIHLGNEEAGISHLGIEMDTAADLADLTQRIEAKGVENLQQKDTTCCHHRSDKTWVRDPQNVIWENFLTHGLAEEGEIPKAPENTVSSNTKSTSPSAGCC